MKSIRLSDVLELPVEERLELVGNIWDSIAQVPDAVELTDSQRAELDRRLEAYRRDPSAGSPWAEVKARILSGG
ncbi:MAG: addiction module protein [Steroidobacteraceae bacterium]